MLSKAQIKLVQSLSLKKKRGELKLFVVEGKKQVAELLTGSYETDSVFATQSWLDEYGQLAGTGTKIIPVTDEELKRISLQQAPQQVLALARIPGKFLEDPNARDRFSLPHSSLTILLDGIQDPGNLGTIVRIADWYGIRNIICSTDCVDVFNPKTIQATMGSFLRVDVWYADLAGFLSRAALPVYGALMSGTSLHGITFSRNGLLLIGNEGKGISEQLIPYITHPVTIPRFGGAESLNAGIATAVICDAWARTSTR